MSYWHIVDLLMVLGFFRGIRKIVNPNENKAATTSDVVTSLVGIVFNVFLIAYLLQNIEPDIARIFHSVAMCHG